MRARLRWATEIAALTLIGCGGSAITCFGCSNGPGGGKGANGGGAATAGSTGGGGASGSGTGGSAGTIKTCLGDRVVNNDTDFDALVAEGCEVISGDLRITRVSYSSLNGLQSLTSVGEDLELINVGVDSLSGLEGLTSIGGALSITNTDVSSLNELASLTAVGGTLGISLNSSLTRLGPLHDWPSTMLSGLIAISFNTELPQCEVEAFDSSQVNAACNEVSCASNDGTGTCP